MAMTVRSRCASAMPQLSKPQIDVFGEIMDTLHHGRQGKLAADADGWDLQRSLIEHLETIWEAADHGIWEVRGDRQHFTHSQGHGLGGLRSRRENGRAISYRAPDRTVASPAGQDPRGGLPIRL